MDKSTLVKEYTKEIDKIEDKYLKKWKRLQSKHKETISKLDLEREKSIDLVRHRYLVQLEFFGIYKESVEKEYNEKSGPFFQEYLKKVESFQNKYSSKVRAINEKYEKKKQLLFDTYEEKLKKVYEQEKKQKELNCSCSSCSEGKKQEEK